MPEGTGGGTRCRVSGGGKGKQGISSHTVRQRGSALLEERPGGLEGRGEAQLAGGRKQETDVKSQEAIVFSDE